MKCVYGRAGVRYVITKFSRMDSLPNFATYGAPLRALRARELRYKELRNRIVTPPTAKLKFNAHFVNDHLNWKIIYSLPYRVALDTKTREFQYKLLNRCLVTNTFLCKIGIIPSPACSLLVEFIYY